MPGWRDFIGGKAVIREILIWNTFSHFVGSALGPFFREAQEQSNQQFPNAHLTPAEAADLVDRNVITRELGEQEASAFGINPQRFDYMVKGQNLPPGPEALAEAARRGIIPESGTGADTVSYEQGIAESHLQKKWGPTIRALARREPTPSDILSALLEGQIEYGEAQQLYERVGGDPQYFELLFNTHGQAPTPTQAAEMANRGLIPWEGRGPGVVSFEQAFLEGPWRNKWLAPFRAAAEYFPPPRTITAMVRDGSLSDSKALDLWRKQGLSDEIAAAYLQSAKNEKTSKDRDLTVAVIRDLYEQHTLTREDAAGFLKELGYDDREAGYILLVSDLRRVQSAHNRAIATVRARYTARRIDRSTASRTLDGIGVNATERDSLLDIWDDERDVTVALLTPTQIKAAAKKNLMPIEDAKQRLRDRGYDPRDVDIFLAI